MEKPYPAYEFEAEILPGGLVRLPPSAARVLIPGVTATVRISVGSPGPALRKKGVTEDEIERISTLQMEQREQVVLALRAEGILGASNAFRAKARTMLGKKT